MGELAFTSFSLTIAGTAATIVFGPSTVKCLTCSDSDNLAVRLGASGLWESTSVAVAGKNRREKGQQAGELSYGKHFRSEKKNSEIRTTE